MSTARTGRRPGDPEVTRRAILSAARSRFADVGFDLATIRAIAAEAGVDPALVHHHFGSKQELFAAAHELPVSPAELLHEVAAGPRDELGERIIRFYLSFVGVSGSPALSLLRAAATNDSAARMLREFIEDALLKHADELVDLPDARLRVALVGAHMIGVVFGRTLIGIPDLANADMEAIVTALSPTIQRYLTDPDVLG